MRYLAPIGLVLAAAFTMPGCIIWDAYDQLELANKQLGEINANLAEIDGNLEQIDTKLATIDANLDTVDTSLSEIKPMLAKIDEHLASLRKTINNIDSTIPFLKLSGDDEEEQDALEAGESGAEVETPPAQTEPVQQDKPTPPAK